MPALRFLFISDSHEGGHAQHACLHPRYVSSEYDLLLERLGQWVARQPLDFVIHGGDIIDAGYKKQVMAAADRFKQMIPVPTYLCLGNHDLARQESIDYWREHHQGLLPDGQTDYHWSHPQAAFYVMCAHWHPSHDFYWEQGTGDRPTPRLTPSQLEAFERFLQSTDKPVVLTVHAPVEAVQPAQSGKDAPWHPPHEPYRNAIYQLAHQYANLRLILTGHTHATNQAIYDGWAACNNAAFNEAPAQARLITIDQENITVDTLAMATELDLPTPLDGRNLWGIQTGPTHRVQLPLINPPTAATNRS